MFDIIGYWGVLTITLMSPILAVAWVFADFTNARIEELGGNKSPMLSAFSKFLNTPSVGLPMVLGCVSSAGLALIYAMNTLCKDDFTTTFIGWYSDFAEALSPVSGFILCAIAALVVYDMALRAYVRINKIVSKLEQE